MRTPPAHQSGRSGRSVGFPVDDEVAVDRVVHAPVTVDPSRSPKHLPPDRLRIVDLVSHQKARGSGPPPNRRITSASATPSTSARTGPGRTLPRPRSRGRPGSRPQAVGAPAKPSRTFRPDPAGRPISGSPTRRSGSRTHRRTPAMNEYTAAPNGLDPARSRRNHGASYDPTRSGRCPRTGPDGGSGPVRRRGLRILLGPAAACRPSRSRDNYQGNQGGDTEPDADVGWGARPRTSRHADGEQAQQCHLSVAAEAERHWLGRHVVLR